MKLSFYPYELQFKFPFRIAHGIRKTTPVIYVKLENEGRTGWGEAALPPYLPETQKTVTNFLTGLDVTVLSDHSDPAAIFKLVDEKYPGNMAAKAALDMALWNLKASIENKRVSRLLNVEGNDKALCTYTLGIGSFEEMKTKVEEADKLGFEIFKIKLDGNNDEEVMSDFKKLSTKPFAVDVNQAWQTIHQCLEKINWLKDLGCVLVEQPMKKDRLEEMSALKRQSSLPIYADESCQRTTDLEKLVNCFDGINVKLMKCGGITEAYQMIQRAKNMGFKILIGCMSESSLGCNAAAQLSGLADYTDLDGPWLVSNDPFSGVNLVDGKISQGKLEQVLPINL